jgi:uncharacterized membrane protein
MNTPAALPGRRLESIDVLRGVVMILMALDHVRDYFGDAAASPTNLATTTVPLFFTRWVTHFCAPTFFFLTGAGAYLAGRRRGKGDLARFLLTRGLWMILLDLVILRCLGWQFNFDFRVTFLLVLWGLGWAMITLAALVRFPIVVPAVFGLTLILGHNLLDGVQPASLGAFRGLWLVLHQPGLLVGPPNFVLVAYPLIPWVGVTAAGYAFGAVMTWEPERRRAFLLRVGLAACLAFVALRWINVYGDPFRWSDRRSALLSFLNTTKYPPSLLFLLMTLGPALLFLRAVDGGAPRWLRPAIAFGRVPLFYFAMHIVLIHVLAIIVCWFRYGEVHWMFESPTPDRYPVTQPPGWPMSLPIVYGVWMIVVLTLWPLCRWFASLRARRSDWWLSYL